jgi:ABC-type nitrate/sulfonate/bicarbonate transport system ATPase subunit
MTSPKLSVRGVSKVFEGASDGDDVLALAEVDLHIGEGEFVSIVGPSGCGKSTLFNIIAGLLEPTTGTVSVAGHDGEPLLGSVGLMPQRDLLMPWQTVLDNTSVGLRLRGRSRRAARREALAYFDEFGLKGFENRWPSELSGGMRQRAALLRTFLGGHDLLLLDEPFGALDALTRRAMQSWLLGVWGAHRRTILFITHDVDEAILLSDRVYVMTGRPGGIALEERIDLARPREHAVELDARFTAYKHRLIAPLDSSPVAAGKD